MYKLCAMCDRGKFFIHKQFEDKEIAEKALRGYQDDPDLTKRGWKFWLHGEKEGLIE